MSTDAHEQLLAEVRRMADLEEIKQLKGRYCRCVDAHDWDGWANDVLTEDFRLDSDGGTHIGRDVVVAFVSKALNPSMSVHQCHTPDIELTGPDTATGTWAMNDYVVWPGDEADIVLRGYGHYNEDYVRTANGWRIKWTRESRLRVDTNHPLVAQE